MPRISARRRRLLLPILVAGALSLGATAASGLEPWTPQPLPESAFAPVTLGMDAPVARDPHLAGGPARSHAVAPIADPWLLAADPADRARPRLPVANPIAVPRPTAAPQVRSAGTTSSGSGSGGTHSLSGRASWYCEAGVSPCSSSYPDTGGFDAYGAAGPKLRAAIGSDWRGTVVTVDGIRVKLIDWCQCYQGESNEKLIDLYHDVFLRTGSSITIRW